MIKKVKVILVSMMLLFAFVGCTTNSNEEELYTPGTYNAEVMGMHEMTVEVTFSSNKIEMIKVAHSETEGIGDGAVELLVDQILELQGLGLDTITGATLTSQAILDGVADCVLQANGDVEALKEISPVIEKEADVEIQADVVVIGAGGAGMAAAVTANQDGKTVVVIEKTSNMGGNTALAGGAFNAVDDGSETALAHQDSVELFYNQTYEGGDMQGDPVLIRTLVENSWDGVEWLQSLGMQFYDDIFTVTGGMWERAHKPVEPEGSGFFKTYQAYMDGNDGITMQYNTTAKKLLVENGAVVGVECEGKSGNKVTVRATNGVVLATGGFSQNIDLREKYNSEVGIWPMLDETIPSTNTTAITGDGIVMAEEIGANLVQMGYIQMLPLGDPNTGSLSGNIEHGVESRIFINKEGTRFVNEGGRRDEMTLALFNQTDTTMFIVMDSDAYPTGDEVNNFNESVNSLVSAGRAYQADSLEELAELMGVPADTLIETVTEYNRYCLDGELEGQTDEFGRTLFTDANKVNDGINDAPFYAAARVPTVHHTMGGVQINQNTEVLNINGEVIPGLYAAGEVTGGIHGANRLGGNALTDTIVFGRIAGEKAANFER